MRRESFFNPSATFRLAVPMVATQLAQMGMGFLDTVMVGHYSAMGLAAVSIGSQSMMLMSVIAFGIIASNQGIIARLRGENAGPDRIRSQLFSGLAIALIYGFTMILASSGLPYLLRFFQTDPQLIAPVCTYARIYALGLPALFGTMAFRTFHDAFERPLAMTLVSAGGLITNGILNWMWIYGNSGAPELGSDGAAMASAVSLWTMFFASVIVASLRPAFRPYRIGAFVSGFRTAFGVGFRELVKVGIPSGMSTAFEWGLFIVFAVMMGRFGAGVAAANHIALNYSSMTFMIPFGISMALQTQVGFFHGEKQYDLVGRVARNGILLSAAVMTISSLALFVIPETITGMYTNDPETAQIARSLLVFAAIYQVVDGIQVSAQGCLRGIQDTRVPMLITLISYWGVGFSTGVISASQAGLGAQGLWIGMTAGLSIAAPALCTRFFRTRKRLADAAAATASGNNLPQESMHV